jgi:hypothetical protein
VKSKFNLAFAGSFTRSISVWFTLDQSLSSKLPSKNADSNGAAAWLKDSNKLPVLVIIFYSAPIFVRDFLVVIRV